MERARDPARPLGEFERIERFFMPLAAPGALGLRDDAALIDGPDGQQLVLTADAIVAGVHFLPDDPADLVARKLLRVNLSDLAAMGAAPLGYLLTTALPRDHGDAWLEAFARGLAADQEEFGIALLGGDSTGTPGPASLSLTALGTLPRGRAIRRGGGKIGDSVFVSGTIGDAALGLKILTEGLEAPPADRSFLVGRYHLPQPRVALGQGLHGLAHAMLDVSDGLVGDLLHICEVSRVGAVIEAALVPLSPAAAGLVEGRSDRFRGSILTGGDDYELLFTAGPEARADVLALGRDLGIEITEIGRLDAGAGVRVLDRDGAEMTIDAVGWRHF